MLAALKGPMVTDYQAVTDVPGDGCRGRSWMEKGKPDIMSMNKQVRPNRCNAWTDGSRKHRLFSVLF